MTRGRVDRLGGGSLFKDSRQTSHEIESNEVVQVTQLFGTLDVAPVMWMPSSHLVAVKVKVP